MITASAVTHSPSKASNQARSRQLALMTKNLDSPISKGKSPSFKKYEDDLDLVLDDDSEVDEPAGTPEAHVEAVCPEKADNSWMDYGEREFALVFSRKTDGGNLWKLEATVQINMEYPLRPPLFSLSLHDSSSSGNENGTNESDYYNELRATTVVDVGLCKPVDGKLLVRSFRGRDHRKMISWKDRGCASGYPC